MYHEHIHQIVHHSVISQHGAGRLHDGQWPGHGRTSMSQGCLAKTNMMKHESPAPKLNDLGIAHKIIRLVREHRESL